MQSSLIFSLTGVTASGFTLCRQPPEPPLPALQNFLKAGNGGWRHRVNYWRGRGCIHGEELPYLFGAPLVGGFMHFSRNYTKSEVVLSETTMIYWSNFARTGFTDKLYLLTCAGEG
ncbi:hypothetical protein NQ318_014369 [Aromia moschata]|uniref:Carboxylesterase type B domain-containing protein n=1 Tax=Aromia moschata TaxID=1265417 RepID=A0AAV8YY52_9CUCU|nr:hypothetical protein NQ318_014369 [Aromia moschata]